MVKAKVHTLVEDSLSVSASLDKVSPQSTREHQVRVALNKDLEVEQGPNLWVVEGKNAFDENDTGSVEVVGLLRPLVQDERVVRDLLRRAQLSNS